MKMFNKKALGWHWYILFIAIFSAIGYMYYSTFQYDPPKVGEYSINIIKTFEENSRVPVIIEEIVEWANEKTIEDLKKNEVFNLKSYCDSDEYIKRIKDNNRIQKLSAKFGHLENYNTNCIIDEDDIEQYFEVIFKAEANDISKGFNDDDLDISNAEYTSSVEKEEDGYFNKIDTKIEIPINIGKYADGKYIGKIIMESNFKLPVDYSFDEVAKKVCILSVDCGATCKEVRYAGYGREPMEKACDWYSYCDKVKDDFGKVYECDEGPFCEGRCCDDLSYDLECGETTECGRAIGGLCDEGCPDTLCSSTNDAKCGEKNNCDITCGTPCDDGCPDADVCGKCDNECPPPLDDEEVTEEESDGEVLGGSNPYEGYDQY